MLQSTSIHTQYSELLYMYMLTPPHTLYSLTLFTRFDATIAATKGYHHDITHGNVHVHMENNIQFCSFKYGPCTSNVDISIPQARQFASTKLLPNNNCISNLGICMSTSLICPTHTHTNLYLTHGTVQDSRGRLRYGVLKVARVGEVVP